MKGWFKLLLVSSLLLKWTCALNVNGHGQIVKTSKAPQNSVNDFRYRPLDKRELDDYLELQLTEIKEEVTRMERRYDRRIQELETRVRGLEDAAITQEHYIITLKQEKMEDRKYIDKLEKSLAPVEKEHESNIENSCKSKNCSTDMARENTRSTDIINVLKSQNASSTNTHGVAFYTYMASILRPLSARQVLVFDVVKMDTRNAYHSSTGVFVVPLSGVYVFTWTFRSGGKFHHAIQLMKNTEECGTLYLHTLSDVEVEETGIVVTHVNAGDDVYVRAHASLGVELTQYIQSDLYGRSSFAGWRLF